MDILFNISLLIVWILTLLGETNEEFHAPCYGCQLFNIVPNQRTGVLHTRSSVCQYPCKCPVTQLRCNEGVSIVKDGCGCCFMCARQRGDTCSKKDVCDVQKGLYCDTTNSEIATCQAKVKKSCVMDGVTYGDGQQFRPDCSRLCTCQNGYYGCVSQCLQESQQPSSVNCRTPRLVPVSGKCCKEWLCENRIVLADQVAPLQSENLVMHSENLVMQRPFRAPTTPASFYERRCHLKTTNWTPCSTSCGVGVSVRVIAHSTQCRAVQERRICFLRECNKETWTLGRSKCTPTTRSGRKYRIEFQDCRSVKVYNMKFCTNCRKGKCCYPRKTRTRLVEFQCSGGQRTFMNFMWVKRCRCDNVCYVPDRIQKPDWGE